VDPFAIGVVVVVVAMILASCLAARASAGKRLSEFGARGRDRRPTPEADSALDAEDLAEMLAVTNARRRARGLPERSVAEAIREFGGE
jgi:hypothetical protein